LRGYWMDEDELFQEPDYPRVYVRKKRGQYSGMMLQSLYWVLRGVIIAIVLIGFMFMFEPLI